MEVPFQVSGGKFAAFRLIPGQDLISGIRHVYTKSGTSAMSVVSCVGSVTRVCIRHANKDTPTLYEGHFEITALSGIVDDSGEHVHISIADGDGRTFGGHLMPGSAVYTTAEMVVALLDEVRFARAPCARSGYDELVVEPKLTVQE